MNVITAGSSFRADRVGFALRVVMLAAAASLTESAPAAAQDRDGGFLGSLGVGGGWNLTPPGGSARGRAAFLQLGGTLARQVLLGGETISWVRSSGTQGGNLTLIALLYPSRRHGFVVKTGVGFGVAYADELLPDGVSDDVRLRGGLGTILGAGWEVRIRGNFYVTVGANWVGHFFYEDGNEAIRSPNHFVLLHVGPMWH
jgi:hypothetical protein